MRAGNDIDELLREHLALLLAHGRAQLRCSTHLRAQAQAIERLQALVMRLRGKLMERESQLAWLDDLARLESAAPAPGPVSITVLAQDSEQSLRRSFEEADLVICQTGCLSHDNYWRVHDHCRRTGRICLLVERPDALRALLPAPPADAGDQADGVAMKSEAG